MLSKQLFSCSNLFQVICSSKFLLKNFRWLKFDFTRYLNNSFIVQGVTCSSLRYSIYKVQSWSLQLQAFAFHRDSFYMLSQLKAFVKNFFQVFQRFFKSFLTLFRLLTFLVSWLTHKAYYTASFIVCQHFFHKNHVLSTAF